MKTPADTRVDQLRQEIKLLTAERDKANDKIKLIQQAIVVLADATAAYFGKSNPFVKKLLDEVKEIR